MQDLQDGARLGNALFITSNEQVSGSNSLVGSPKDAVLQVKREVRQRVEPRFTATVLVPVIGWLSRVRPRRPRGDIGAPLHGRPARRQPSGVVPWARLKILTK